MPDFEIANAEFKRQADILRGLVKTIEITSTLDCGHVVNGTELPPVPAGSQNTMAAAAIVLLAAHFEEYVRQQIEEYAKAIVLEYEHLPKDFRTKLIDTYWKAGAGKLGRIRPSSDIRWNSNAETLLQGLMAYPVGGNASHFVAALVCEHENNMRWDTVTELSGRVGVKDLPGLLYRSTPLRTKLDFPRKDKMAGELKSRMNNFYSLRNGIVHSIAQSSGVGFTIFDEWVGFFLDFVAAFSDALTSSFETFTVGIKRSKTKVAS